MKGCFGAKEGTTLVGESRLKIIDLAVSNVDLLVLGSDSFVYSIILVLLSLECPKPCIYLKGLGMNDRLKAQVCMYHLQD